MTMTDKPSPATDEEIAQLKQKYRRRKEAENSSPFPYLGNASEVLSLIARIELPTASDADIDSFYPQSTPRRQAEWFKIKARIEADRALILPSTCSSSHAPIRYAGDKCPLCEANQSRHEAVKRWEAVALELEQERDAARAALSRPSEAPAPMPEWEARPTRKVHICGPKCFDEPEGRVCRLDKPGADRSEGRLDS